MLSRAEHARYALSKGDSKTGRPTVTTVESALGRGGELLNAFVDGFLEEANSGQTGDIYSYMSSVLGAKRRDGHHFREDATRILQKDGISSLVFDKVDGFVQIMFAERDDAQEKIAAIREQRGTYKHERQVKAEAEALLLVRYFRSKVFSLSGNSVSNAFFVSHTRVIDDAGDIGTPITIRPESLLQWVNALRPCGLDELSGLTAGLLWELAERDLAIVNRTRLRTTFQPLIDASQERLNEELERHHELIAAMYGEKGEQALMEANGLEVPGVLASVYAQGIRQLQEDYASERAARIALQAKASLVAEDIEALARFRAQEKQRKLKSKSKKRAAASRPRKKNKRPKRK